MIDDIIQKQVEEMKTEIQINDAPALANSELICDTCEEDMSLEAYEYFMEGYKAAKEDMLNIAEAHLIDSMKKVAERIAKRLSSIPHGQAAGAWGEYVSYPNVKEVIDSLTDKGE